MFSFHLGLYDLAVEGEYRWVDCTDPTWSPTWAPGQPSDTTATENCVSASVQQGTLNDMACDTPLFYICEITPKGWLNGGVVDVAPYFFKFYLKLSYIRGQWF